MSADDADLPIVDAHHHLWDLEALRYPWLSGPEPHEFFLGDLAPLKRNYLPADYRRDAAGHNVVATVHVEAECDRSLQVEETIWVDRIAEEHGMPAAIVGHAWFHREDCAEVLERHVSASRRFRGVRSKPVTAARPGLSVRGRPGSMQDENWLAGLALMERYGLSWDLRVPAWHLEEAAEVARAFPGVAIVLNHTGFPWDRSPEGLDLWRRGMAALAGCPNVSVKLSCLCLPDGPWREEENGPLVRETVRLFGAERCMFASNFPVDGLRIGYGDMMSAYKRMVRDLPEPDRRALFHDTAARFYRLDG